MRIQISINANGMYWRGGASVELDELQSQCFEPLKTCSEPIMAYVAGDKLASSEEVRMVIKTREDAAKILSEELAALIISEMKKNDTHDGYTKEELNI